MIQKDKILARAIRISGSEPVTGNSFDSRRSRLSPRFAEGFVGYCSSYLHGLFMQSIHAARYMLSVVLLVLLMTTALKVSTAGGEGAFWGVVSLGSCGEGRNSVGSREIRLAILKRIPTS